MNIQQKILQFRKDKQIAGKRVDNLVYRVDKDDGIELVKYYSKIVNGFIQTWETQTLIIDAEFAIKMANDGVFKPLHEFISSMDTLFGVEIHPDWQEFTNKNMYY